MLIPMSCYVSAVSQVLLTFVTGFKRMSLWFIYIHKKN